MHISINERLRPFCHLPGTSTLLPGAGYQVQIFPCLIRFFHFKQAHPLPILDLHLNLKGPVQQFTIYNDLEKGCLTVSGFTASGWMRYHLISASDLKGVRLLVEKAPTEGFLIDQQNNSYVLHDKEWLDLLNPSSIFQPYEFSSYDRLSFGNHKAQDWELIKRRFDLKEIFPFLHRLGQMIPLQEVTQSREGTLSLLEDCRQSLFNEKPDKGQLQWHLFLLGCFNQFLVPQLIDFNYQGLTSNQPFILSSVSPFILLSEGSRLIRELFVRQEQNTLLILPYLLPCLPCGRLINVSLEGGGKLSIEWTKKTIRRLILFVSQDQELEVKFRSVLRYRLRQHSQEKGEQKRCHHSLFVKKNCYYFFDNFQ